MIAIGRHDVSPSLFGLQTVLPHQAAEFLTVHHYALMAPELCRNLGDA